MRAWEDLASRGRAECLVCGGELVAEPATPATPASPAAPAAPMLAECRDCGSSLA